MTPSGCRVHLPVASPTSAAFPKRFGGSASPKFPRKETLCGMSFEIVRPPGLFATQVSPTAAPIKARRTAVTYTPEQITHRYRCVHRAC